MNEFKLEIDTNTKYMKIIRGIGKVVLGMVIGSTIIELKNDLPIDWMNTISLAIWAFLFSLFPGRMYRNQALIINEEGIFTKGYSFHFQERSKMNWDDIRSLRVSENWFLTSRKIVITNSVGATQTISLPLYTKSQLEDLKLFLQNSCSKRQINYTT